MERPKRLLGAGLVTGMALALAVTTAGLGGATPPIDARTKLLGQGTALENAKIRSVAETDVVVARNAFDPGGSSGWHSHPGVAVIVVRAGEITISTEPIGGGRCTTHTYEAGQTFLERPANTQNGVNNGHVKTIVVATFFRVPHGGSARIEQPDPGDCPA
jgi:quercetin dioxygenase-like cupin family protein